MEQITNGNLSEDFEFQLEDAAYGVVDRLIEAYGPRYRMDVAPWYDDVDYAVIIGLRAMLTAYGMDVERWPNDARHNAAQLAALAYRARQHAEREQVAEFNAVKVGAVDIAAPGR